MSTTMMLILLLVITPAAIADCLEKDLKITAIDTNGKVLLQHINHVMFYFLIG